MAKKNRSVIREDVIQLSFEAEYGELTKAQKEANDFKKDMGSGMKEATNDVRKGTNKINKEFKSMKDEMKGTEKQSGKLKTFFKKDFKEMSKEASNLEGTLGSLKGVVATLGIGAGIAAATGSAVSMQSSGNKLQGLTGASGSELDAMKASVKNIYKNNLGESMDDVAVSLAEVKTQTNLSGEALEKMTSDALVLRDTFGFDVKESVRSADMMMKQFGISGDRAYDLLVQGAQKGLDKNGNLLDSMNEYSIHFKQMGFGAEDMMAMFSAASEKGVFDIDKVGDAVKEFGIRAIDGSDTTAEGFKAIGLNANTMAKQLKAGGEEGKKAFQETIKALKDVDDPLKRETAGVALFGTMWEDLGADAMLALGDVKGEITEGTQALDKLNEVRYDDALSALQAFGREINVGLAEPINKVLPVVKELIPHVKDAFGFIGKHLNVIVPVLAVFGTLMGLGAIATNGMAIAQGLLNGVMTVFKPIMLAAKGVQLLFNTALFGCPLFWIVAGITAVIAAAVLLVKNWDTVKAKFLEVWSSIKETFGGIKDEMIQKGKDIIEGIKEGIKSKIGEIKDAIGGVKDKLLEGLSWFKFGSPSKQMKKFGGWTTEGFGEGVEDESKGLKRTVKASLTNPFKNVSGGIVTSPNDYTPSTSSYSRTSNNETNYFSPQFNLTVASSGDRDIERKVKKWVKESLNETFESMNRRNGRLTEV